MVIRSKIVFLSTSSVLGVFGGVGLFFMSASADAGEKKVPVIFNGGHETEPEDGGRPAILIAAALGVKPEEFRKAFSGVRPSRDGRPSRDEARRNKAALMSVLQPLGVTNDRLDEVSDYYRYQPQRGELWKTSSAKAYAIIEDGKIKKVVVTKAGSGYSSPPTAKVQGFDQTELKVKLRCDEDLEQNGSIDSIEIAQLKRGEQ